MDWKAINLHGGASISRVANIYELRDFRIPSTIYRVKVLERDLGDFLAVPNVVVKNKSGDPELIAGLGRTEHEALQDIIDRMDESLMSAERLTSEDFEWSDPRDF
ncbi:hypothetical protein [Corallococcus sp. RDP092CA]|uniref:hypothetical protein n=1 Tax=Corallococcus sp. RDP092CA TaxID=3109369 RepID=UPI0035B498DE